METKQEWSAILGLHRAGSFWQGGFRIYCSADCASAEGLLPYPMTESQLRETEMVEFRTSCSRCGKPFEAPQAA